jgi:pimeloyl-ACP methyl ester carboxylesterase
MNTNDLMARWAMLSYDEIEDRLRSGSDDIEMKKLFGAERMDELHTLASQAPKRGPGEAVVLLPGFTGSLLASIRGVISLLWINPLIILQGRLNYLELGPDGTRDLNANIETIPLSLEKIIYLKIALTLRKKVDLYEFPYDWRKPMELNADLLHDCIERWADGNPKQKFTLVGHSMGGIISRAYLARHTAAAEQRIKRVIMHGTPHFGAAGTVETLIMGNGSLNLSEKLNQNNMPRRVMLNMPSAYELLPAPPGIFPTHRPYPANWDIYNASAWRVEGIRQDYLDLARRFHEALAKSDPQVPLFEIAGCHLSTLVEVRRSFDALERPSFELVRHDVGPDGGDATCPLWSAVLPHATKYYVQVVHRYLPSNDQVIGATLDLINGDTPDLPSELPPPKTGLFGRSKRAVSPEAEAQKLRRRMETGTASEEDMGQLMFGM